jgi:hypothetical protein
MTDRASSLSDSGNLQGVSSVGRDFSIRRSQPPSLGVPRRKSGRRSLLQAPRGVPHSGIVPLGPQKGF